MESFPAWRSSRPTLAASRSFYAVSSPISRYASASSAASSAAGSAESSSAEGTPGTLGTTGNDHHPAPPVSNPLPRVATPAPTGILSSPRPAGQPRQRTANTPADHYLHGFRAACPAAVSPDPAATGPRPSSYTGCQSKAAARTWSPSRPGAPAALPSPLAARSARSACRSAGTPQPAAPPAQRPAAPKAPQRKERQAHWAQLAMITIPPRRSASRSRVSPRPRPPGIFSSSRPVSPGSEPLILRQITIFTGSGLLAARTADGLRVWWTGKGTGPSRSRLAAAMAAGCAAPLSLRG